MRWLAADSAERSASRVRACAWRSLEIEGKLSPAQFGVIRRSLNATWYDMIRAATLRAAMQNAQTLNVVRLKASQMLSASES
jgi:hypothetical protein